MILRASIYSVPPESGEGIRLAIYQGEQPVGTKQAVAYNLEQLKKIIKIAKQYDSQIISFPELYLTGYALDAQLVTKLAQPFNGHAITQTGILAKEQNIAIVLPYAEVEKKAEKDYYYDSIALIDQNGLLLENYRKTHLFDEAEKLNFSSGESDYPVHLINDFPIGLLNCYEGEFPELIRILALNGARLIVVPTAADYYYVMPNNQKTTIPYPDISKLLLPAESYQNDLFIAYANRYGYEKLNGKQWHYQGNSIIVGPHGDIIVEANHKQETLLIADIVPKDYGPTHPAGADYLNDRKPELYKKLVATENQGN
jgi:predicted amidohydrolase